MKKLFIILINLSLTPLFVNANYLCANSEFQSNEDKKEYDSLLEQCRTIKSQIMNSYDFGSIAKRERREFNETQLPALTKKFHSEPNCEPKEFQNYIKSAENDFAQKLYIMQTEHALKVNTSIRNEVSSHLNSVGTITAFRLLARLIIENFKF